MKKIKYFEKISSYSLRESGLSNNRYGWYDESTDSWIIPPTFTFYNALCFDLNSYFIALEILKNELVKTILLEESFMEKVEFYENEEIELLKNKFGIENLSSICENYDSELCSNVSNDYCFTCMCRLFDYESLTNNNL